MPGHFHNNKPLSARFARRGVASRNRCEISINPISAIVPLIVRFSTPISEVIALTRRLRIPV